MVGIQAYALGNPPRVTAVVVPVWRSWTKMSELWIVSPGTRLSAMLVKATYRPSADIEESKLFASPWAPAEDTLTRSVEPVWRSWTKTSVDPFVSPGTRLVASL